MTEETDARFSTSSASQITKHGQKASVQQHHNMLCVLKVCRNMKPAILLVKSQEEEENCENLMKQKQLTGTVSVAGTFAGRSKQSQKEVGRCH